MKRFAQFLIVLISLFLPAQGAPSDFIFKHFYDPSHPLTNIVNIDLDRNGMVTDFTGPTVTIAPEASNYEVGDTVSFTVVAEDETTASEDILLDIEVTYGSGDTFEVIEAENNSFVAEKAGDYTVTVTATDEFGNETIESITITVSEASSPVDPDDSGSASTPSTSKPDASTSEPGPSDPVDEPAGLEPGAIAGIVIGAIAGVAIIGFLVWFFLLRKNKGNRFFQLDFRDTNKIPNFLFLVVIYFA